jgi:hypothetical protein
MSDIESAQSDVDNAKKEVDQRMGFNLEHWEHCRYCFSP